MSSVEWRVVVYDREKNTMAVVLEPGLGLETVRSVAEEHASALGDRAEVRVERRHVGSWQAVPEQDYEFPKGPFVVVWTNPVTKTERLIDVETWEDAVAKVEHYHRKYGSFEGYKPAVFRPAGD